MYQHLDGAPHHASRDNKLDSKLDYKRDNKVNGYLNSIAVSSQIDGETLYPDDTYVDKC